MQAQIWRTYMESKTLLIRDKEIIRRYVVKYIVQKKYWAENSGRLVKDITE